MNTHPMAPPSVPLTVVDFLSECAFDMQARRLQPLGHYVSRYSAHAEAVAREYLLLVDDIRRAVEPARQLGRYQLLRELGRGGQGRVHLARDPELGRFAAVKVLELTGVTDSARRERFRREIDAVVRIDHPHVCRLFEADVDHAPPYAAMELVPGHTLAELIGLGDHAHAASGGLVRPRNRTQRSHFVRYFEQVARALHAVHSAGIVHRDLKPANLMVTPNGEPRVLDFGLASPAERIGEVTLTDALVGTLPYMAPEQLQARSKIDRRCDVFALGLTMFECLTGERPFPGKSPAARLESIAAGLSWRRLQRLPRDLRAILDQALQARPEHRYATCEELAQDLLCVRERRPVAARRPGPALAALRWCTRHPVVTSWFLACCAAIVATFREVGFAKTALAASQHLEGEALDAMRSLDRWYPEARLDISSAAARLQGSFAAGGEGSRRLAMLHLRRDDAQQARRQVEGSDALEGTRKAALLYACDLIARDEEDTSPLPELPPGPPEALADECTAIARELFRYRSWRPFDALTRGVLAQFQSWELLQNRLRLPLVALQLQADCVRENPRAWFTFRDEVQLLGSKFGDGSAEVVAAREHLQRAALPVVPGSAPLQALRFLAKDLADGDGQSDSEGALRRRAFALGITQMRTDLIAPIAAILDEQSTRLGPGHPDVIFTRLLLGHALHETGDRRAAAEVLAMAWAEARSLGDQHAELRTMVLVAFSRLAPPSLDEAARADLCARALHDCLVLWGPWDPRTSTAFQYLSVDAAKVPQAAAWIAEVLAMPTESEAERGRRDDVLGRLLARSSHAGADLAVEQYALALLQKPESLRLFGGRVACQVLAWHWRESRGYPRGQDYVPGMTDAVQQWRLSLGDLDPGEGLLPCMILQLAGVCNASQHFDTALELAQEATHLLAREVGKDHPDWLVAAESLPMPDPRSEDLLGLLATLFDRRGQFEVSVRLWRCAVPAQSDWDQARQAHYPGRDQLRSYARALMRLGRHADAEAQLQRCLEVQRTRREEPVEFAKTYRVLRDLYVLSDQPAKAAAIRKLLEK